MDAEPHVRLPLSVVLLNSSVPSPVSSPAPPTISYFRVRSLLFSLMGLSAYNST